MAATAKIARTKSDPEIRRAQILQTATHHFAKNGYANADLQEIADELGIAKGTIYLYYRSKKQLFYAAVDQSVERLGIVIGNGVSGADGPVNMIRAMVRAHFGFFERERHFAEIIARERGEFLERAESTYSRVLGDNSARIERILKMGVSDGTFHAIRVKKTAEIIATLLTGTIYTGFFSGKNGKLNSMADETTEFLLHGLMVEKGNR